MSLSTLKTSAFLGDLMWEMHLAAVAIAVAAGADPLSGCSACRLRGVEHRLEYVLEHNGSAYYNNSKATNSKATVMALNSFKEPVVLIAGGLDRGSDIWSCYPYSRNG